jgi:hypothetical protein
MYFDDCERMMVDLGDQQWSISSIGVGKMMNTSSVSWAAVTPSQSEEKRLALDRLVGYNAKSSSILSDEKVEEETLRWAVDTNLVWTGEEEDDDDDVDSDNDNDGNNEAITRTRLSSLSPDRKVHSAKYECIKDLRVASSCTTTLDCLTLLWEVLVDILERERATESQHHHQQQQQQSYPSSADDSTRSGNAVHLIVFPKSDPLWNYDTMAKMLTAIQISKPFLPSELELKIDLFHPSYKNSPKMWSPETHSPFPTVGLSISEKSFPSIEKMDVDAFRKKLNIIFQSVDAIPHNHVRSSRKATEDDHQQILKEVQLWWFGSQAQTVTQTNIEWMVQSHDRPFQLYNTLWNTIRTMTGGTGQLDTPVAMIVVPSLDSHTLQRVAVTVNVALRRLDIPVRITQVYRPQTADRSLSSTTTLNPSSSTPYGMIQLSPLQM